MDDGAYTYAYTYKRVIIGPTNGLMFKIKLLVLVAVALILTKLNSNVESLLERL
jgi:hypothetical protein